MPTPARFRVSRHLLQRLSAVLAGGMALVVFAPSAFAETDSVRFEYGENGTWTVPDDVTEVTVEVAGAGGGGALNTSKYNPTDRTEYIGGAGALVTGTISATPGETFTIGVGGGGTGRRGDRGGGGGGGASIVTGSGALVIAGGGGGAGIAADGGDAGGLDGAGGDGGPGAPQAYGRGGDDGVAGQTNTTNAGLRYDGMNYDTSDPAADGSGYGGAAVGGAGSTWNSTLWAGGWGGAGYGGGAAGATGVSTSWGGGAGGSIAQGVAVDSLTITYSAAGGAGGVGNQAGVNGWVVITWVVPRRLSLAAGTSNVEASSATVSIQLRIPSGMACGGLETDRSNAWMRLPAHSDCLTQVTRSSDDPTTPSDSSSTLLGWATTPDFPRDIAQRQVDNGWGAYELTDDDGNLSAVFIPGGGWVGAGADTTLHPIWSEAD